MFMLLDPVGTLLVLFITGLWEKEYPGALIEVNYQWVII